MQIAKHIVNFRCIYGHPKRSNVFTGIKVSIFIVSAVVALKRLIVSNTNIMAARTSLGSVSRFYYNQFNSTKFRFIFKFSSKVCKVPSTKFCFKLLRTSFASKSNVSQIFNSNSFIGILSRLNNRLRNSVINNCSGCSFSPTKPFQKLFSSFSAFGLNRTPNFLPFLSVCIKPIGRVLNTITCNNQVVKTKIAPNKLFNVFNRFIRNINRLKQIKFIVLINQISFTFNKRQVIYIMAYKRNFNSTFNTPYRNNIIRLISKYSVIIRNSSILIKNSFNLFINLITISNFSKTPSNHLGTKIKFSFSFMIRQVVELKLIKSFRLPSSIRDIIARRISQFHSTQQKFFLFDIRSKFNFECQYHSANIKQIIHIIKNNLKAHVGVFLPDLKEQGFQRILS